MSAVSMLDARRTTWIAMGAAFAVGIAVRLHNAFHYTSLWGFDALYNWRYIQLLTKSWKLPAPDAAWATAHPPLFYYVGAAICRGLGHSSKEFKIVFLRIVISAAGLLIAVLAVRLVRRLDPGNLRRALLAGALVLFLPVHVYMSAMLSEEIVVATLISVVLASAAVRIAETGYEPSLGHAAYVGVVAGLALLTKLTGVLVLLAVAGTYLVDGWRRGSLRSTLRPITIMTLLTGLVGGWFYVRNLALYGYLYPHGLAVHEIMFTMPPGEREILDYLRVPLATWTDPQLLNPDLLRSVWGSTYVTMWFDGHRSFLPTNTPLVTHAGTLILSLALLPTAAFGTGLLRGIRRAARSTTSPDVLLLLMIAMTLSGFVLFTWKNPWFATCKASFLLGLTVPFAYYTSEVLDDWMKRSGWVRVGIWTILAVLAVVILGTFTFSEVFWNTEHMDKPGVLW